MNIEKQNYRPTKRYIQDFSDPKPYQLLIALVILCLLALWALTIATNRICERTFSPEFIKTQAYKNLKCD